MSARPRILHLHSTFAPGGKELRCVQLINAFGSRVEHAIVSGEEGAYGAADRIAKGAKVRYPRDFPPLKGRPLPGRLVRIARAMQGYDLVCTYNWGAMDAVLARTVFGDGLGLPPLIHHEDGFNEDEYRRQKTRRIWLRRIALARAYGLVVPSATLEAIARESWQQTAARIHRIPNGIDTRAFARRPRADALPGIVKHPGDLWIGTLAGLRPVKQLDWLVRALPALPAQWHLVIVGEGPERAAIRAEADRLEIGHRVHLPGFVPDPARYVGLFDIFALSSASEQFPISVAEAMAGGLPVAAPAVGDIRAMVAPENAEAIVAAGDEAALGAALATLAADRAGRLRIGEANRRRAAQRFDERAMIESYRALYGAAMGRDL